MHTSYTNVAATIGRVLMAALFIPAGAAKLATPASIAGVLAAKGLPMPDLAPYAVGGFELIFGLLILVGLFTRFAALLLGGFCVVSGIMIHFAAGDMNNMIHFSKNIALAGGFLQLVAWGAGAWSLDAIMGTRRPALRAAE